MLEKAEGNGFLRAAPRLGSSVPVHATAVGKLFLAFDPDAVRDKPEKSQRLERFTPATIVGRQRLSSTIAEVAAQGWAVNEEEWMAGLCVAAAPIYLNERLYGAVALATVAARYHEIGQRAVVRRVTHAAQGITFRLEGAAT